MSMVDILWQDVGLEELSDLHCYCWAYGLPIDLKKARREAIRVRSFVRVYGEDGVPYFFL